MRSPRIACVYIRDFGLHLGLRHDAAGRSQPAVLAQGTDAALAVEAANEEAAAQTIAVGMTIAQARARASGLCVVVRRPESERRVSRAIVTSLLTLTPGVEEEKPGTYFLEALGTGRLYGSERAFAERALVVLRRFALPVRVGVAHNTSVARIAAAISTPGSFTIVPPGRERRFLGSLPVDHMQLSPELRSHLETLGLNTMEQIALLPSGELGARFGREGVDLALRARGGDARFFVPEAPTEERVRAWPLVLPLFCCETLAAGIGKMLAELFAELRAAGRACRRVCVTLDLEDGRRFSFDLALADPGLSVTRFRRQLDARFEKERLAAGVKSVLVRIAETAPLPGRQLGLRAVGAARESAITDDAALQRTSPRVLQPRLAAGVRLESTFELVPEASAVKIEEEAVHTAACCGVPSVAGLRLWQPPRRMTTVWERGRLRTIHLPQRSELVRAYRGPWTVCGGWWDDAFDRLYYEVETARQVRYLVFFERRAGTWFGHGMFD